ncbi:hypothetical protein CN97_02015 [Haematobacter massiliensis]|uniref:Uncharacterized protein n=1 Tax=Haematobacter massiliensis TaxID=195105 RepID=A0A086XYA7_9RHOB|nr:hypothetical protein CN97_02015 [Haematobacter massiliensis]
MQTGASGVIPVLARPDAARMAAHGGLPPDVSRRAGANPGARQKPTRAGGDVLMSCRPASRACPAWSACHGQPNQILMFRARNIPDPEESHGP